MSIDQSDTHRYPCFLLSDPSSCIAIVVDLKRFLTRSSCSYTTDKPINLLNKILFNYPKTNRSVMKTYEKCFRPLRFMEPTNIDMHIIIIIIINPSADHHVHSSCLLYGRRRSEAPVEDLLFFYRCNVIARLTRFLINKYPCDRGCPGPEM